jgi:CO/xanthine dehydrogenase FAD-binding subunit
MRVRGIEKIGVEFNLGVDVGKDVTLDHIKKKHACIFLATGAWDQPTIGLGGEALTKSGLELLTNANLGIREVPGRRVVVIGGGNVAVDAGITIKRLGAEIVTLVCLERWEEMPAFECEVAQAVEEGIELMPSWGPSKVVETDGRVTGLELVRCTSVFDGERNFSPTYDTAVKLRIEADQVIKAVGQRVDLSYVDPGWSLETDQGFISVDPATQATDMPAVFAGGDATSGPSTVVEAIFAGRRASVAIDRYLGGTRAKAEEAPEECVTALLEFNTDYLKKTDRVRMSQLPVSDRKIDAEDILGFGRSEVETEANRCFNCGCVAVSASDIAPALVALNAKIKTTRRTLEAEDFFAVRPLNSTILDHAELVTEIQIPVSRNGSKLAFLKFRIRNSIDFPIVSVATVLEMNSGKIDNARIVLGAVAPIPLRVGEAEDVLKGKKPSEKVAENAAGIAVKETIPLAENQHKVQIVQALVKRAILSAR